MPLIIKICLCFKNNWNAIVLPLNNHFHKQIQINIIDKRLIRGFNEKCIIMIYKFNGMLRLFYYIKINMDIDTTY